MAQRIPGYRRGSAVVAFLAVTLVSLGVLFLFNVPISAEVVAVAMVLGLIGAVLLVAGTVIFHHRDGPKHDHDDPLHLVKRIEEHHRSGRVKCMNCGYENKGDAEACASCGHELMHVCRKCKTKVRLDWTACPECGTMF